MIYYILFPGDDESATVNDRNKLGHISFNTFHPNDGFLILKNMVNQENQELENIRIINSKGETYSLQEFMNKLDDYSFNQKNLQ